MPLTDAVTNRDGFESIYITSKEAAVSVEIGAPLGGRQDVLVC